MKTHISRQSYRRERRFSAVMQQQGRMITDADVNESEWITDAKVNDVGQAAIGSGIPDDSTFRLTMDEGHLQMTPGALIAEGAPAWVAGPHGEAAFDYAEQPDYPVPPSLPDGDFTVFADVWDRTVVAAQDRNSEDQDQWHLRDPGLHGADTTTRTQRLVQIKVWDERWAEFDLENPEHMPKKGTALATFTLRTASTASDDCDPCAEEVELDQEIGNYLFRLEVHDVTYAGENSDESHQYGDLPLQITLKWSRENGAEHSRLDALPDHFKNDVWIYEFFNDTTEKHMGLQMLPYDGELENAPRSWLQPTFPEDDMALAGYTHVRRWDGFLVLQYNIDTETYTPKIVNDAVLGRDRGEPLGLFIGNEDQKPNWGDVIAGQTVSIYAERMTLDIELFNKQIMVGDYWNTPVRELIHDEETAVLLSALPQGIEHRYLTLFRVRNGRVINNPRQSADEGHDQAMTAAEERKLAFPKLTDIPARKVSYDPCLHHGSPFQPTDDTVQAALDRICQAWPELKSGGGCTKTVGPDGDYLTLEQAFEALLNTPDICLCLLPGDHFVSGGTVAGNPNGLRHLTISGCGAATRVYVRDNWNLITMEHLVLKQVHLFFETSANISIEFIREVTIQDSHFYRSNDPVPLLICANCENLSLINTNIDIESTDLLFKHRNIMQRAFDNNFDPNADPFIRAFDKVNHYSEFTEALAGLLKEIHNMPASEISDRGQFLRKHVDDARANHELNDLEWLVYNDLLLLLENASEKKITEHHFQLIRMSTQHSERGPALEIGPAGNNVRIEGCRISGEVTLHARFGKNPKGHQEQVYADFFKGHLTLRRNHIARLSLEKPFILFWAEILFTLISSKEPQILLPDNLPKDLHPKGGPFYRLVEITDNVFALPFNKIFGEACRLNSNLFSFNFPLIFNHDGDDPNPSGKDIKRIPVLFDVYSRHSTYLGNVHNARMEMDDLYAGDHFLFYADLIGYDYFNKIPPENTDPGTNNHIKRTMLDFQNDLLILPRDLSDDTP